MAVTDHISRRRFLEQAATVAAAPMLATRSGPRPNFLILATEDITANLHCFGDAYSITPNLDRLAQRGCAFTNAWSNAPVCAPSKTTMWSGLYATATGAEHMRSLVSLPEGLRFFPSYLREAGYHCTMNGGNDLNIQIPAGTFDYFTPGVSEVDASGRGHWRARGKGQPFFAFFNDYGTHESRIRALSQTEHPFVHDPSRFRVPSYHPDTPEVRRDWAQYYDNITTVDASIQRRLDELAEDGLVNDTIVLFISDHGAGMPRSKRFPFNAGLNVPVLAVFPPKFRHLAPRGYVQGGRSDRLIGHIDLAPSILSAAGVAVPRVYQGQAYMGARQAPPREYNFGFRGRMDERHDLMRTARDRRYVYVRNYNPHKIYGQHLSYMWGTKTTDVWERLYKQGVLEPPQTAFWETKPAEELYDLQRDPDEVRNLANDAQHRRVLERFRKAHESNERRIRDVGLLTEAEMHSRASAQKRTPWELGQDPATFPVDSILAAADLASSGVAATPQLLACLQHADSGVRYWGVVGLLIRGAAEVNQARAALVAGLEDESASVRIAAAEALGRYGDQPADATRALDVLLPLSNCVTHGTYVAILALNAVSALGDKARGHRDAIAALPRLDPQAPTRVNTEYVTNLLERLKTTLGTPA